VSEPIWADDAFKCKQLTQRVCELEARVDFLNKSLVQVAEASGISTPLMLWAMADSDNQTYADLLVKHVASLAQPKDSQP
jgi:hypothetical protein